jgi:deoxyribonuclease-4
MKKEIMIGAHLSISGGLEKAVYKADELGINALQIFTKNASTWKEKTLTGSEIGAFLKAVENSGVKFIFSHDSYLINLASPDKVLWEKSVSALENEITRAAMLSLNGVILHPGMFVDSSFEKGLERIISALNSITAKIKKEKLNLKNHFIILETTAGQGSSIGCKFEEINDIISGLNDKELFAVCFDSAHVFASGYDISNEAGYEKTFIEFEKKISIKRLAAFHLNDTQKDCGSRVDRHEHIGRGRIGKGFFRLLMNDERFKDIPKIIETPKGDDDEFDRVNLDLLKKLAR